jgi:hypothetical protein
MRCGNFTVSQVLEP